MRILVCGGRAYSNSESVDAVLGFLDAYGAITAVVHGGAAGADTLAGRYATKNGIPERVFHADWAKYGPRAGPIRNAVMLAKGNPDIVVAFPGGRGTADMVRRAHEKLVPVLDLRPFNQSARD